MNNKVDGDLLLSEYVHVIYAGRKAYKRITYITR